MKTKTKKLIFFVLLNFLIFFGLGKIFYDKRSASEFNINMFLNSLENEKMLVDLNIGNLQKNHDTLTIRITNSSKTIREVCYKLLPGKLEKISECKEDLTIIFDEHAISSLITAPYNPINLMFSEFIWGHIKVNGIKISDIMAIV